MPQGGRRPTRSAFVSGASSLEAPPMSVALPSVFRAVPSQPAPASYGPPASAVLAFCMALGRIESIFHPSDFSEASAVAFDHALKIALASRAALNMLHVAADPDADWSDFPGVRATLERWRLIPPGSPKSAVAG